LRNFAVFLSEKLKDFARADDYFARALEVRRKPFFSFPFFFRLHAVSMCCPSHEYAQARPDDNEIAWQYWRFLREKLKQPGRAIDLAPRAHEHQAMMSMLTSQPVRLALLLSFQSCFLMQTRASHGNTFAVCCGQSSQP
jgi:hypothetical protein